MTVEGKQGGLETGSKQTQMVVLLVDHTEVPAYGAHGVSMYVVPFPYHPTLHVHSAETQGLSDAEPTSQVPRMGSCVSSLTAMCLLPYCLISRLS